MSSSSAEQFLIAGVITAAPNFNQRSWIRRHYDATKPPGVQYFFVLGNMSTCKHETKPNKMKYLLHEERMRHRASFHDVAAQDCAKTAVAQKSLAWLVDASKAGYRWIAKLDDDSLADLRRLHRDALLVEGASRACAKSSVVPHAYYGVMRWRSWTLPEHRNASAVKACADAEVGCACGGQSDAWPPGSIRTHRVRQEECPDPNFGPFPFADGSMWMISSPLATAAAGGALAPAFARDRGWLHEDVGIGYLLLREALAQRLPLMYVALMEWVHHVRWVDVRGSELSTAEKVRPLFGGAVLGVHRVGDGWQAEMARDAFDRSWADAVTDDKIVCRPCAAWEARGNESSSVGPLRRLASAAYGCCHKARPGKAGDLAHAAESCAAA